MSTYMANPQNVERSWYVLDAEGKTLGALAVEAATLLRGKHKVTYTPHVDCGDNVIIVNASKIVLTGKKADQKMYYHHTGYIGHMKSVKYSTLLKSKPVFVVEKAVKGMLPANTLGRAAFGRLHVYAGPEHKHAAQKPEAREF
ncbi:MAG: 50S ribosomal protein L13 [Clostridia bacterium]|nr:50S ribosomal protein L13 [Clostridia bacterium]MBR5424243.1 50S ribosomal protein L13 [Clostridia bacterium]